MRFKTVAAALIFLASPCLADTVRVTAWNLRSNPGAAASRLSPALEKTRIQEAAAVLKKLNPDVIVLQQIRDRQTGDELARALRPESYHVVVCPSLHDPRPGTPGQPQVAILSRAKAYISWSEPWMRMGQPAAPGGVAFAALRLGNKNIGVFSVQIGEQSSLGGDGRQSVDTASAREAAVRQLCYRIDSLGQWITNRVEALVVAGDFNPGLDDPKPVEEKTMRLLEKSGLANVFASLLLDHGIPLSANGKRADAASNFIFIRNAGLIATPQISKTASFEHSSVTCDFDLDATGLVAVQAVLAKAAPVKTPSLDANHPAHTVPELSRMLGQIAAWRGTWWLAGTLMAGAVLFVTFWKLAGRLRLEPAARTRLAANTGTGAGIGSRPETGRIVVGPGPAGKSDAAPEDSAPNGPPIVYIDAPGSTWTKSHAWQQRAEEAERRAGRADAIIRAGLIPHLRQWLKHKVVRRLVADRAGLLDAQQAATRSALAVEERLAGIESRMQQRQQAYEQRIDDLMNELALAREENRELIRTRIAQARAGLEAAKARQEPPGR